MQAVFGPGASVWPEGLAVPAGEGPRTALRVEKDGPLHLPEHLDRLVLAAQALGRPAPWVPYLAPDLERWISPRPSGEGVLRLALHPVERFVAARLEPLPATPSPYRLVLRPHPLGDLRTSPLARHKGLTGPWRTPVLAQACALGADDALLTWPDGTLAETAIAAVALETRAFLVLPPPEGRVGSLGEQLDLPAWAEARNLRLIREPILPERLREGRLWCLNAARGIWSATLI